MTTIVVTKNEMGCDLQLTHSSGLKFKGPSKIMQLPQYTAENIFGCTKAFVGFCGNADQWLNVTDYLRNPEGKPPKLKGIELLMLNDRQEIYHATTMTNWTGLKVDHFSIGSGSHLAMGAMESGKSIKEALKIAAKFDPSTGLGFKFYKL